MDTAERIASLQKKINRTEAERIAATKQKEEVIKELGELNIKIEDLDGVIEKDEKELNVLEDKLEKGLVEAESAFKTS